jgi:hypothetical protein
MTPSMLPDYEVCGRRRRPCRLLLPCKPRPADLSVLSGSDRACAAAAHAATETTRRRRSHVRAEDKVVAGVRGEPGGIDFEGTAETFHSVPNDARPSPSPSPSDLCFRQGMLVARKTQVDEPCRLLGQLFLAATAPAEEAFCPLFGTACPAEARLAPCPIWLFC